MRATTAIVGILLLSGILQAGFTVIGTAYEIQGQIPGGSFVQNSATPISRLISDQEGKVSAQAGPYYAKVYTSGGELIPLSGTAKSVIDFQVDQSCLQMNYCSWGNYFHQPDNWTQIRLEELNSSQVIYDKVQSFYPGSVGYSATGRELFHLNPDGTYRLTLIAHDATFINGGAEVGVDLQTVPAPGALLLASLGAACLKPMLQRRRRQNAA